VNSSAQSYAGANLDFTSSAKVLVAMVLTNPVNLSFGTILVSGTAGTVIVGTDGIASSTALTLNNTASYHPASSAAGFKITGSPGNTYEVVISGLTAGKIELTNTITGLTTETMQISALKIKFGSAADQSVVAGSGNTSTIGAAPSTVGETHIGSSTFTIGGTLTVAVDQAGGTYTNTTTNVSVDYN
jgi:hypothetical protein